MIVWVIVLVNMLFF